MNGAWCIRSRLSYSISHCFPIQSFPFNSARPRTLYYIISNLTRFFLATYIPPTCPAPIDTNASLVIKFTSKFYCRSYHPPLFISRSPPFNSTPFVLPHDPLISHSPPNHSPIFTQRSPSHRTQIPFSIWNPVPSDAGTCHDDAPMRPPCISHSRSHSSSTRLRVNSTRL